MATYIQTVYDCDDETPELHEKSSRGKKLVDMEREQYAAAQHQQYEPKPHVVMQVTHCFCRKGRYPSSQPRETFPVGNSDVAYGKKECDHVHPKCDVFDIFHMHALYSSLRRVQRLSVKRLTSVVPLCYSRPTLMSRPSRLLSGK